MHFYDAHGTTSLAPPSKITLPKTNNFVIHCVDSVTKRNSTKRVLCQLSRI